MPCVQNGSLVGLGGLWLGGSVNDYTTVHTLLIAGCIQIISNFTENLKEENSMNLFK